MNDMNKTRAQLLKELEVLRQEVATHSAVAAEQRQAEGALRAITESAKTFTSTSLDITEQKRVEQTLREEAEIAAALARVGRELIVSLNTPATLDRLCRLTAEVLRGHCSCTVLWQPQEQIYAPVASWGTTPEHREALQVLRVPRTVAAPFVTRLEAEEIMEVQASESVEPFPEALLQPFGLKRALCLSLWRGHELIGIQVCGYQEGEACTPRDLRVARGISQLASLALANAELLDRLEQADRLKSDFLSSMSHELRTPLHIILGYTGLLAEETFGPLTAAQRNSLERMEKSARELLALVNAALDLSRLQSQGLPLHVQAVDPTTLVTELMADTCSLNRNPDLKLEYRVDPELPRLHTDLVKLKMVLKHLLTNVLKFTERGTISLAVEAREDGIEFTVSDTGIAIPADELSLIFEPFRHGMAATRGRAGAVGLGLYIVRLLLDVLQGRVSVTSEVEKGTTFRVWIPPQRENNS